jgi:hypothetical protein
VNDIFDNLVGAFTSIPSLPGAACKGDHARFESSDQCDVEGSIGLCLNACPALDACEQFWLSLPPRHRPTDCTVAGEWRPAPRQKKRNEHVA